MADDPVFIATPGGKLYNSDLDSILKQSGITTLVLSGASWNIGVLYTAGAAAQRGYTVVVAEDAIPCSFVSPPPESCPTSFRT